MNTTPAKLKLQLTNEKALGRIAVDMEAFFDFSFWMAEELEDLVGKWSHTAAPHANRCTLPIDRQQDT